MLIKPRTRIALLAGLVLGWLLCAAATAAEEQPTQVKVTTTMGDFVIELRSDRAPITTANFLRYVREGFYTNTLLHRVIANFVIQGGGHDATPPYALKPTDPPVNNESGNGLQNKRGAVGLARASGPDTGNSQFYINLVDNPELDPLPTRWGYAVFGKVVQGMDVVDKIGVVPTGSFGPFKSDAPLTPVIIQSIDVITPPQLSSPSPGTSPAAAPAGTPPSGSSSSGASSSGSPSSGSAPSATPPSGSPPSAAAPSASPQTPPGKAAQSGSGSSSDGKSTPPPAAAAAAPAATAGATTSGGTADQPSGSAGSRSQTGASDQPDGSDLQ